MNRCYKRIAILLACLMLLAAAPEPRPVRLALVGDLMLGRGVNAAIARDAGGQIFAGLEPWIRSADAAFGNLESPLSEAPPASSQPYNLCAPAVNAQALRAAGFDLLSTANNHSRDCFSSKAGAELVRAAGMQAVDAAFQPVEVTVRGVRLAFLAGDDVSAPVDLNGLTAAVRRAHESGAIVIVSMHWGLEYQAQASPRQRMIARQLAGAGARLVAGHHPHVIQAAECLPGASPEQAALILYSLGNALFDQYGLPDTRRGLLASVDLSRMGAIRYQEVPFDIRREDGRFRLIAGETRSLSCPLVQGK